MAIHGTIEEAGGLADVLQLIALGRKSGCLMVSDGDAQGRIYLDLGQISFASVANRRDRLGEMLVKSGRITREQLTTATEMQRNSKRQLGRILVDTGSIDRAEVEMFIRIQVQEAVYLLFTWTQGSFTFTSEKLAPHQSLLVSLDAESLLLEGARRVDEWDQIQKKIPSFDLVYRVNRQKLGCASAEELTDDQNEVVRLLDGTRDVAAVIELSELGEFEVGKALYGLVIAGFAQLVERRAAIRHLDYRELLAYVVREAEFSDPQRRKDAGRHIVDCPSCADRLRTIHVRRTTEGVAITNIPPESETATAPAAPPPVEAPALAAPVVAQAPSRRRTEASERRGSDRRTGRDRRDLERREQVERRVAVSPTWHLENEERRMGQRRVGERRGLGLSRERRSADFERRVEPVTAAPVATVRGAAPSDRMTSTRQRPVRGARRGYPPPRRAVPPPAEQRPDPVPIVARTPEPPAVVVEPPPAPFAVAPPAPTPPVPTTRPAKAVDASALDWLVSPEESIEMIRVSRTNLPAIDPASRPARPATPVPQETLPRIPLAVKAKAAATVVDTVSQARAEARPRRSSGRMVAPPIPSRINSGHLKTAALLLSVGVVSYFAGQLGSRSASPATPVSAEAPAVQSEPVARAPQPAATRPAPAVTAPVSQPVTQREQARVSPPVTAPATQRPNPSPTSVALVTPPPAPAPQPRVETPPAQQAQPQAAAPAPAPAPQPVASAPVSAPVTAPAASAPPASGPSASEPDRELAGGGWTPADRSEAAEFLGGMIGVIQGLRVESIAKSTAGPRPRVRVVQLTDTGERIILTQSRAGAAVSPPAGTARVTSVRVMPPSEAYPLSTGTVSLGNVLITAKSSIAADVLRPLLERLADAR